VRRSSVTASSRPVKLTGWKLRKLIFLGLSSANWMMWPDLLVVDAVDDGRHGDDVDTGFVQVVDGLELHVEQVADFAVRVGSVADAVELQVGVTQTRFSSCAAKLFRLRELDAVGRGLY
jgi:hypothetical protein